MPFPFPDIKSKCLVCFTACGARWKGYYIRRMIHCDHVGPVAIHVGHCRKMKQDFSYFPDFLIPGRQLSRPTFKCYLKNFHQTRKVKASIDELVSSLPDMSEFTVALSTAYNWIYQSVRALRINASKFAIFPPTRLSAIVFYNLVASVVCDLFLIESLWHPAHHIIIQPP